MKTKLGIVVLFLSMSCFAHKDKVVHKTYGNVKVYMRTGFEYLEFNKIQVVGQLSEELSKRLHYRDTIFIEYIHDYSDKYTDDLYILESNNSNYKILGGIRPNYKIESNGKGLSVRICTSQINIVNVLKLVEYTILNNKEINSFLTRKTIGYNVEEERVLYDPLISDATDDDLIKRVISSNPTDLIRDMINEKVLIKGQENYGLEVYWQDDKFLFEYNHFKSDKQEYVFEIRDYFYHIYVNVNTLLIFVDKNSFYYLDGTDDKEKELINIDNGTYVPMQVIDFGNKLLFYEFWNRSNISVFLKEKNKVISKFE